MKEDFLHYLWKHKKFDIGHLKTTAGAVIALVSTGMHNQLAGPDFFNARLRINGQLWAGNVELHVNASQWYAHGHEQDPAYDNVILHVVWEEDIAVYGANNAALPTLELKRYVSSDLLNGYQKLFYQAGNAFINCEQDFASAPAAIVQDWLERLYLERLERKVLEIEKLLQESRNDWETVLFNMLARNFGTKINGAAFADIARTIPFKTVRKASQMEEGLEALLLGHAHLLPEETTDAHVDRWKKDCKFLKKKFDLPENRGAPVQFFRLRPPNFPTLRLSQLAALYTAKSQLFSQLMQVREPEVFYELLSVKASAYWDTRYNFGKTHKAKPKQLSSTFINLLLINTIIPLKFAYSRSKTTDNSEEIFDLVAAIPPEKNQIVARFFKLRALPKNALTTQALLQLKNKYCDPNACLKCRIGNFLISNPDIH
ncbi:MAG TPA: DUF2851 family protein [Leeuwenhoekiella sp.]|nr:DUF2851 family protein [Leeuwenhoekiella sp.]